jgi:hypothetical protein
MDKENSDGEEDGDGEDMDADLSMMDATDVAVKRS